MSISFSHLVSNDASNRPEIHVSWKGEYASINQGIVWQELTYVVDLCQSWVFEGLQREILGNIFESK